MPVRYTTGTCGASEGTWCGEPAGIGAGRRPQRGPPSSPRWSRLTVRTSGGIYGIAGAVDALADRLYDNVSANNNPHVAAFHAMKGHAGFKYLVTAWSIEHTGGPKCYPGRDMRESHAHLHVSEFEFDIVATEIAATLFHVGVPRKEHKEFMDIIESYRSMVVGPPGEKDETETGSV
ncbi:MAG: group 1 truncated hemoglobin [Actinomycetota bacterium]|nr:group 1 truncated hemoglobin [Actinomycetota bacterium]